MAWYNASWLYRVGITSQNAKVDEAVTNAYIDLSEMPSEFWTHVKNGGGDIRVTKADGITEVAREVVTCDTGTDTGEIHFDCTGIQTGSDIVWYIYYGNAAASDYAVDATYGARNAYGSDYQGIWHNKVDLIDILGNNDFTNSGSADVVGKLGRGRDFELSESDYLHKDVSVSGLGGAITATLSVWVKRESIGAAMMICVGGNGEFYKYFMLRIQADNTIRADFGNDANNDFKVKWTTDVFTDTTGFHLIHATYNAGTIKLYLDAAEKAGTLAGTWAGAVVSPTTYLRQGNTRAGASNAGYFDGIIDEVRISNAEKSANWITTEYNNQNDPATFWSIGAEEEPIPGVTSYLTRTSAAVLDRSAAGVLERIAI